MTAAPKQLARALCACAGRVVVAAKAAEFDAVRSVVTQDWTGATLAEQRSVAAYWSWQRLVGMLA